MKTIEEVKKGLECCAEYGNCSQGCPYNPIKDCGHDLYSDALTLIKQLEDGIDRYCGMGMRLERERDELFKMTKQLERERDAALKDIPHTCKYCANESQKWLKEEYPRMNDICCTCIGNDRCNWEWIGVREVENDGL